MATRFWVGGTGTWDAATTTHWAATTGAAGGASVPGSADAVTFDGASGGGVVTVNFGGTITVQSITCGAFTGTLDFSANNNNVTLSVAFNGTGSGTRTVNLGNGTWTLSSASGTPWTIATTTGLTFNANSSVIVFSGNPTSQINFSPGAGLTYSTVTLNAQSSRGGVGIQQNCTIGTLNMSAPNTLMPTSGVTLTITNAFNFVGTASNPIGVMSSGGATISVASGSPTMSWAGIRNIAFTGGAIFTATSSSDLGQNTGITITAPSAGGGGLAPAPIVIGRGTPY